MSSTRPAAEHSTTRYVPSWIAAGVISWACKYRSPTWHEPSTSCAAFSEFRPPWSAVSHSTNTRPWHRKALSSACSTTKPVEQRAVRDHELRIDQTDHVLQDRAPVGRVHRDVDRTEHHEAQHEPHHRRSVVQPHQHPIAAFHPEHLERGSGPAGNVPGVRLRPGIAPVEHHQRAIAQAIGLCFEDAGQNAAPILQQRGSQVQQAPVRHFIFQEPRRAGRYARRARNQARAPPPGGRSSRFADSTAIRIRRVK